MPPDGAVLHQVDLSDRSAVLDALVRARPEVVLHSAYDMAAGAGPNSTWTKNILDASTATGARFIFVSTDLVFGANGAWHKESDPPEPTLEYGRWKALLEQRVLERGGMVVRTALVWGIDPVDRSTQSLVLDPLITNKSPRLFEDEWRTPTEVHDLAAALIETFALTGPQIFHCSGPERLTRLQFGRMIARYFGYEPARLPASRRVEIAPDRPRDTSLARVTSGKFLTTRFRGPSEVLGVPIPPR